MVVSYCMPGSPDDRCIGNWDEVGSFVDLGRFPVFPSLCEVLVARHGAHELVVHANGVVGILADPEL